METIFHRYSFDITTPSGMAAWASFKMERKAAGARIMGPVFHKASDAERSINDGDTVTLDMRHLFDNQWNTEIVAGIPLCLRVFDWLEEAEMPNLSAGFGAPRGIRRGHWLEITSDMTAIRRDTLKCGYCGYKTPKQDAPTFCPSCIGSEYLTPEIFYMTRLAPVASGSSSKARPPLSELEQAERRAAWQDANREGAKTQAGAKLAAFRAATVTQWEKELLSANTKHAGIMWLLAHDFGGLAQSNTIFYPHTGRFCFGWRTAIDYELAREIMGKFSDGGFPFPYDIKTVDHGQFSSEAHSDPKGQPGEISRYDHAIATAVIWEAMISERRDLPGLNDYFDRYGACEARAKAESLADAMEVDWQAVHATGEYGSCYDWDFAPAWIAANVSFNADGAELANPRKPASFFLADAAKDN